MAQFRNFCYFLTWFCVYLTLVVAEVEPICNIASKILQNMDSNINPCDDFYKFSCGGFLNSTTIPNNEMFFNTASINRDALMEQLRIIIEEEISPNETFRPFRLVKDFYKACMNETAIEKQGLQPLLGYLKKLGGWPVLEGERWNESDFNWIDSVYKSRKLGFSVNYFIKLDVNVYYRSNTSKHEITLNLPSLRFPDYLVTQGFNSSFAQGYYKDMVEIAVLLGADENQAKEELKESLEFEIMLSSTNLTGPDWLPNYPWPTAMTVNQLSTAYPSIPWWEYLNTIITPISRLTPDEIVTVKNPNFLKKLEELMNTTSKRVQANYALWRAIDETAAFTDIIRRRNLKLHGEGKSQWQKCVQLVSDHLDFSVGAMYFDEGARTTLLRMVDNISDQFYKILKNVEWIPTEIKAYAMKKTARMTSYVFYPDELWNIRKLGKLYDKLELNADDFLGNKLNMTIFETNHLFDMLNKPAKLNEYWRYNLKPTTMGAYYQPDKNNIQIPAGIMQGIFFNNSRPHYMNYGAIGSIIGHEITHVFETTGIYFDRRSLPYNRWNKEDLRNFDLTGRCMCDQVYYYRNADDEMRINRFDTLRENVADNGGVKIAYYAYKKWVERNGREERLPGLSYTPNQMFWISYANALCSKYRRKDKITRNNKNPAEFRVNGPLSNIKEFSRDFHCPIGSKMNPTNKCAVW